jgi:hypothetical protein
MDVPFQTMQELRELLQAWHEDTPCPMAPPVPQVALTKTPNGYTYQLGDIQFSIDRIAADMLRRAGWRFAVYNANGEEQAPSNEYDSLQDVYSQINAWRNTLALQ